MKLPPILVSLDTNEAMRPRAAKIEQAVEADDRFSLGNPGDLPFDLQFIGGESKKLSAPLFNIELKDFSEDSGSDYLRSILSGHLYEQILAARERQEPVAVVVLGDDNDVGAAIRKAASRAQGGRRVDPDKQLEYFRMVEGLEANCIALNIPVWRLKTDPWKRMLLRVRKILQGGDLTGFRPKPDENERNAVGLSMLCGRGVGVNKARSILLNYDICLMPKLDTISLEDCSGIGKKLSKSINRNVLVLKGNKREAET